MGTTGPISLLTSRVPTSVTTHERTAFETREPIYPSVFMANVLPAERGLQSVGYQPLFGFSGPVPPGMRTLDMLGITKGNILLGVSPSGIWQFIPSSGLWVLTLADSDAYFTTCTTHVAADTGYLFIAGKNLYSIVIPGDGSPITLTDETATVETGLAPTTFADIVACVSAKNLLILLSSTTVFRSSATDPTDFVPSNVTGAGFSIPVDVFPPIRSAIESAAGFFIFTATNAVAADYTGDIVSPFIYSAIRGAGGVSSNTHVVGGSNLDAVYAWTSSGFQRIASDGATGLSPELDEYLIGSRWDRWNTDTNTVESVLESAQHSVVVSACAGRYIVLSVGPGGGRTYTHAIVFDSFFKRWGRVDATHIGVLDWRALLTLSESLYDDLEFTSYGSLGSVAYADIGEIADTAPQLANAFTLMTNEGVSVVVRSSDKRADDNSSGVLVVGPLVPRPGYGLELQGVAIDGSFGLTECRALVGRSNNQTSGTSAFGVSSDESWGTREWYARETGKHVSIVLIGAFIANSLRFDYTKFKDQR